MRVGEVSSYSCHNTPVGSTTTKSRMPHDLSSGEKSSCYGRQPIVLNMVPPGFDLLRKKMHHGVVSMFLHVKFCKRKPDLPW